MTTIGPYGRPHVRPAWGMWLDNTVEFSTGARHASNIARDPRVTVNLENADDCLIVEGTARAVDVVYVVRPSVVFGWLAHEIAPGVDALRGRGDEMTLR